MKIRWSPLFSWVFCTSIPNQVEHTWLKLQLQICNYKWARIIFVDKGLDSKLQHRGPCKNSWKKSKTSHSDRSGRIKGNVKKNHEQKKTVKKSEKPRFNEQIKLFFENPALLPLGSFSHMAACRGSLENPGKLSLIPVFIKYLPRAHTESELDMLGVHRKLVKYVVHLSKRKIWKKKKIFTQATQTTIDQFLVSRNFRG
jgi:hypothetical protein